MIKLTEYKVVILNTQGEYIKYQKDIQQSHEECIQNYTQQNIQTSDANEVSKRGDIAFIMDSEETIAYMPQKITEEQLYELEFLTLYMDDILKMKVIKEDHTWNLLEQVGERFSDEVIQSYFVKNKTMEKA